LRLADNAIHNHDLKSGTIKKKVILIFLSSFSVQLIIACCNCPEPIIYLYKFEYMSAFNLDNSGANPVISESPIPKSAYGIKLQLGLRQLSQHDRNHFSLFNQAHSAECFCGPDTTIFPRDTITSLTITTATRFSDNHPKGSDVTKLFKVLWREVYANIDSVTARPAIYHTRTETKSLELYLLTPPSQTGDYSFKVDIMLSDKTHISASTKTIELK
jgi:hypothetical protein